MGKRNERMDGYVHDGNREKSKSRLDLVFTLKESKTLKEFKIKKTMAS